MLFLGDSLVFMDAGLIRRPFFTSFAATFPSSIDGERRRGEGKLRARQGAKGG